MYIRTYVLSLILPYFIAVAEAPVVNVSIAPSVSAPAEQHEDHQQPQDENATEQQQQQSSITEPTLTQGL